MNKDDVANEVLKLLAVDLDPQERQSLQKYGTNHSDAYDYYLRARGYMQDYHKQENISAALAAYKRAIELDSNYALAYAGIGEAYWRTFQASHDKTAVDQGMSACQKAVALAEQASEGHFCLGRMLDLTGQSQKAIEQFELAVVLDPNSDEAYRGLAQAYSNVGKPQNAEATFKRAISMRPQYWAGYSWLGSFYFRQARYDDAAKMFNQVLQFSPDNFRAYYNLGAIHVLQGQYEKAILELQKSLELRPSMAGFANLGTAYYGLGQFAQATATYEQALKLDEKDFSIWGNLGDARYWTPSLRGHANEAYARAIELATKQLEVNPRDASTLGLVATYHAMLGNRKSAESTLSKALTLEPSNADLLYRAALVRNQFSDTKATLNYLSQARQAGMTAKAIEDDPFFYQLHGNPEFEAIARKP